MRLYLLTLHPQGLAHHVWVTTAAGGSKGNFIVDELGPSLLDEPWGSLAIA